MHAARNKQNKEKTKQRKAEQYKTKSKKTQKQLNEHIYAHFKEQKNKQTKQNKLMHTARKERLK